MLALVDTLRFPWKKGGRPHLLKLHGSNCPADCPPASNLLACHGWHTQNSFFLPCAHWKGEVSNTIIKSGCPRTYDFQVPTDYTGTPSLSGSGWQGSTLQVAIRAPSKNWMIKNTAIDRCIARLYSSKPSHSATRWNTYSHLWGNLPPRKGTSKTLASLKSCLIFASIAVKSPGLSRDALLHQPMPQPTHCPFGKCN